MLDHSPYLCGGIFFALLLQSRKNREKARNKLNGGTDGLSDTDVLKELIYVVTGEHTNVEGKTFGKATSQYKSCQINGNTYIPFNDKTTIASFELAMKNNYPEILERMTGFVNQYLNDYRLEWLCKALIEIILLDKTIPSDTGFLVNKSFSLQKDELKDITVMFLPIFLLDVLYFIIKERTDNLKGRQTFEFLFEKSGLHGEWKFVGDIGWHLKQRINFLPIATTIFVNNHYYGPEKTKRVDPFLETKRPSATPFSKYIKKSYDFYSKTKTLLYSEKPRSFYSFYVCNTVEQDSPFLFNQLADGKIASYIDDVSIPKLSQLSDKVIIKGSGGIGKSMMMRHFFLSSISEYYNTGRLPILVNLKNFGMSSTIVTLILQSVKNFDSNISNDEILKKLYSGECILLLDGLDEINSNCREKFEEEIELMTMSYPENMYVISSRPISFFISLKQFEVYNIKEFSKEQSISLIEKLEFYDLDTKKKFIDELDKKLYNSHKQFASNPLLLTIMLMTYSSIGEIPGRMHVFYSKAFETMSRLHDATKGAFKRELYTGLTPEKFAEYFAEFCARTYRDETLEFTSNTFCSYMNKVIKHKGDKLSCRSIDFLKDLKDNLCIFYNEGDKYYFIHRSFQEYFTALFYSSQMDDKLNIIGEQFEDFRKKKQSDKTFDMLYDMIPHKIDRYVFLPYLENLWKKCDSKKGYWTFLETIYPIMDSSTGTCDGWSPITPSEYFYFFVVNEKKLKSYNKLDSLIWPESADFFRQRFVSVDREKITDYYRAKITEIYCTKDKEFQDYVSSMSKNYEPNYCGDRWTVSIKEILSNEERFQELIEYMENDEFPLKGEYLTVREFTRDLLDKYNSPNISSGDWFDNF